MRRYGLSVPMRCFLLSDAREVRGFALDRASLQASTSSWLTGLFFSASRIEERYSSFQPGMMLDGSIRGEDGAAGVGA